MRRRSQQVLVLAGLTGAIVGLAVAAFDWVTATVLFGNLMDLPLPVIAVAPLVGLLLATAILKRLAPDPSPATSDAYIESFHQRGRAMDLRPFPARLLASVATLGSGGSLGYEGPALYSGAAIGSWLQRRFPRALPGGDSKVLLVAGAAAGVSAIFKAPVTGLVFALEVPFRNDLARRHLLPAAIASAASYLAFVSLLGTEPLLPVAGHPALDLEDLGGSAVVGVVAGLLARVFALLVKRAKAVAGGGRPWLRSSLAGVALGALFLAGYALTDERLVLGPGYADILWALDPDHGVALLVAVASFRVAASLSTVAGGGVGGLFIPLVVQGAFVGRVVNGIVDPDNLTLFPVVGIAAFLGAGYGVPLAAVVFVAEFTGRASFVVPGLIAAVVAQLVMGDRSVAAHQVDARLGHLERRLLMPVVAALDTEARTIPSDATGQELFDHHLIGTRQRSVVVVDGEDYRGFVGLDELVAHERADWGSLTVADLMRTEVPPAAPSWSLAKAVRVMDAHGADRLAVCDGGGFMGVVTRAGVVSLEDILEESQVTPGDPPPAA